MVSHIGEEFLDFCTVGYLGLESDERCIEAFYHEAMRSGLHLYCSPIYIRPLLQLQLEKYLAQIVGHETSAIFSSASLLHQAVLPVLVRSKTRIRVDEYAHDSIFRALAGLIRWDVAKYMHCSSTHLNDSLRSTDGCEECNLRPLIVTDGVFSMSGNYAPIDALANIVHKTDGLLYVDDSHGFGVVGENGSGIGSGASCENIYVGSLSKSMGCPIAFAAGSHKIIEYVRRNARLYAFSGNVPVPYCAAACTALDIAFGEEGIVLRHNLAKKTSDLVQGLTSHQIPVHGHSPGMVILKVNEIAHYKAICLHLHKNRIVFSVVAFPAIPKGEYRIRFSISAATPTDDIDVLIKALAACQTFVSAS